jgi:hypothetical protein
VTGGWLLEHADWGAIFLVNLPFVAVASLAGRWLVPESVDPPPPSSTSRLRPLDRGLTALVWGDHRGARRRAGRAPRPRRVRCAATVLGLFAAWELRSSTPMLDLRLFRNPSFSGASAAITLTFFALFGTIFLLTQFLQAVLGYSALEAGCDDARGAGPRPGRAAVGEG